jgi:hypothetical protein
MRTAEAAAMPATPRQRVGPPPSLWLAVALVAVLRALPWLATLEAPPTANGVLPPIGYNPKDWLAYVAFVREAATQGGLFLANPFTTEPQDGRYLLLFQSALGRLTALTGLNPFTALELSRVPLLALMLLALWRLTAVVLPDRRTRAAACWLVLLSGGLEAVVDALASHLPAQIQWQVHQDLWHLQGWNTFAAAYNPLWVAALALTFVTLVPLLRPDGPSGAADAAVLCGGLLALVATHPYSAIVVLAVAVARPVLAWLVQAPGGRAGMAIALAGLLPALAVAIALAAWQNADAVYRATAAGALGPQALSVFWYPVTLGVTGVLAVRGWRAWLAEANPCALPMAAWTLSVVFLHTSTVLNGYHFVFHLYTPISVAAAPPLVRAWDAMRARRAGVLGAVVLGVLLFQAPLSLTRKCLAEVETHRIHQTSARVLDLLATLPPGNVLAPADLGNFVPAYGPHRVYAGQWFLTPQYTQRANEALAVATGRIGAAELVALVDGQRLRYLVVATQAAPALAAALGARVERTVEVGELTVLVLAGGSSTGPR